MSNSNLYTLSNKIRTILLTSIDKEISINSTENHVLINSQNHEQLMKKFLNFQNFTIESEELFEGVQSNEDNSIFFDLSGSYSDNKFSYFCNSSKTNNECLFAQNFTTKSLSLKKNNSNSRMKKIKNLKVSQNNLNKLKIDSGKKLITEIESSFSWKEASDFKNLVSLGSYNDKKYIKKFSADLKLYSLSSKNKNDYSSKLINYCNKLKKPTNEIINEISDDDTSTNKEKLKNILFPHRIKNNHKIIEKKLKKIINKKKIVNKTKHNNYERSSISLTKKNSTNFTNQMKLYFDSLEKSNPREKIKIRNVSKRVSNIELKKNSSSHWKNILHLYNYYSQSSEKKSKGKKIEHARKSIYLQFINKKLAHKKSQNLVTYFKSVDYTPIILKYEEKKEKKDVFTYVDVNNKRKFSKKQFRNSNTSCKKNDEFRQNGMCYHRKKKSKIFIHEKNSNVIKEGKNLNISNNNCNNKIIYRSYFIGNKQN